MIWQIKRSMLKQNKRKKTKALKIGVDRVNLEAWLKDLFQARR